MMKRFQYQLRTPFIVLATIAVSVGMNLGLLRLMSTTKQNQGWIDAGHSLMTWGQVPYSVVAVLGIKWILEHNKPKTTADRLVLYALIVNLVWFLLVNHILSYLGLADEVARCFIATAYGSFMRFSRTVFWGWRFKTLAAVC